MAETADAVIVALEAQNGAFNASVQGSARVYDQSMSQIEKSAVDAERQVARSMNVVDISTARAANASRNLGRQISDIGVGLATGQSPFMVLAQQAPQVADALADTGGVASRIAGFFAGPWGAAMLAAASAAGILAGELFKGETAGYAARRGYDAARIGAAGLIDTIKRLKDFATDRSEGQKLAEDIGKATTGFIDEKGKFQKGILELQRDQQNLRKELASTEALANQLQGRGANDTAVNSLRARASQLRQQLTTTTSLLEETQSTVDAAKRRIARNAQDAANALSQNGGNGALANATADLAASTTALTRAQANLRLVRAQGNADLKAGKITQEEFNQRIKEATGAVSDARSAIAGARAGQSAHNKEMHEAAAAARKEAQELKQLQSELDALAASLDPATAATQTFAKSIDTIGKARLAGLIDDAQAFTLSIKAAQRESDQLGKNLEDRAKEIFGADAGDEMRRMADDALRRQHEETTADVDRERKLQDIREDNVRTLAGFYEDLFTGGTARLWDDFKQRGLAAIALVLAKWTFAQIDGDPSTGGGISGLISGIGAALTGGSLFHFASGGSLTIGGKGGVDQNTLSINGQPVAKVSQGEQLNIVPAGAMATNTSAAAPAGNLTKIYQINVSADNSVTPAGFARGLASQILGEAAKMDAASARDTLRATPAAVARYQRFGTTR